MMGPKRAREPGTLPAGLLAIMVHLAFFALLVFGVTWRTKTPAPVAVDLWSTLPAPPKVAVKEPTPPPKPEPVPPEPKPEPAPEPKPEPKAEPEPPKPDIALKEKEEKLKREQEEKQRLESEKRRQEEKKKLEQRKKEEERKKEEDRKKQDQLKEDQAKKLAAQKEAEGKAKAEQASAKAKAQAEQAAANAKVNDYIDRIAAKIRSNTIIPPDVVGNPQMIYEITLLPTGEVLNVRLIKPSGFPSYDAAAERAIYKSAPLPVPKDDPALFASQFRIRNYVFRPEPNEN